MPGLYKLSFKVDVFMAGDELPCHENLFIQQLEGGALVPGQHDFMG